MHHPRGWDFILNWMSERVRVKENLSFDEGDEDEIRQLDVHELNRRFTTHIENNKSFINSDSM